MGTQQFCLKWNNHQSNMLTVFEQLLSTEALVDVTLACDGLSLKAHKMVLSACSPFFQSLFLENPCKHPIVIMKDMRYSDLKAIIDFMYRGEVNVSHDQLNALLRTAETLKVKGLAEVSGENRTASGMVQQEIVQQNITTTQTPSSGPPSQTRSDSPPLHSKRKRGRPRKRSLSDSNRSDDDSAPPKIKEPDSPEIEELSNDASRDANDISQNISSNSQTQVHPPLQSSAVHNSLSKALPLPNLSSIQASQESQVEEPASDDGDFEVEPSKLMEQSLTTDVPVMSNSQPQSTIAPSSVHLPHPSSSGLIENARSLVPTAGGDSQSLVPVSVSIPPDSLSSSQMQGPDSPQDIKPTAFLSIEEPPISPVAGPSHQSDRSMMMYMDTSGVPAIPGTSYQQDSQSAIVQHESQPQGRRTAWWNQKVRIQRLHLNATAKLHKNKNKYVTAAFKARSRQAVCPFCYKIFYDKSTMNRHVTKRVCLGLSFQAPAVELKCEVDDEISSEITEANSEIEQELIATETATQRKSPLEPCPYCRKMLKGERGIKKHIGFYGCPALSEINEVNI